MSEKCPFHDRSFDKLEARLDELEAKMDQILVRLAEGSGVHNLLRHQVQLLERVVFGLVAILLTIVVTAIIGGYVKGG